MFYLAGGSSDVEECAVYIKELKSRGLACAFNWTDAVLANHREGGNDATLSEGLRRAAATVDLAAVLASDILWLVVPKGVSRGCWTELGAGLIARDFMHMRLLIVVSGDDKKSLFTSHASVTFDTHEGALEFITEAANCLRTDWEKGL